MIQNSAVRSTGPLPPLAAVLKKTASEPLLKSLPALPMPSKYVQTRIVHSQKQTASVAELTGPKMQQQFTASLKQVGHSTLKKTMSEPDLQACVSASHALSRTTRSIHETVAQVKTVTSDVQQTVDLAKGKVTDQTVDAALRNAQRIGKLTGTGKEMEIFSSVVQQGRQMKKDLQGTQALLQGDVTADNLKSTLKTTQKAAQLLSQPEVAKLSGKAVAPLNAYCSGKATVAACQKMWDEPSVENLAELGANTAQLLDDVRDTLKLIPGGEKLLKLAQQALESPGLAKLGRAVPGANLSIAALDLVNAIRDVKAAKKDPNALSITNATLGLVIAAGSLVAALNIPGVSQMAATGVTVVEGARFLINTDFKALASTVGDGIVSVSKRVWSWLGG